ncbi:MAG: 50S ribosomal protein L23 [Candidatus Pacebacteria bacterium]|jgi:large subunit ribosomal protein L23|nr:50S ribosomal protein L23 [Candidatus Paceibacterota bacterium]
MNTSHTKKKSTVLLKPRITEKAAMLSAQNVYTFDVALNATKKEVVKAIQTLYKFTPVKVSVAMVPSKKVFVRGNHGIKKGGKKALVYLKKGDTIQFV